METPQHADKDLNGYQTKLSSQPENPAESLAKNEISGTHYQNYVPKHSSHGRLNVRGIGPDHEPGTLR
ncbi:MAG: hypothetical protein H7Y13_04420 [Sphingobacteriaceae bacterium]|nr:hypothetical protein [Sphingobacteriaceae bacterium]